MRAALVLVLAGLSASVADYYCGSTNPMPALPSGWDLQQVQVFIRHGDRTPANPQQCWPNDKAVYECTLHQLQQTTYNDQVRSGRAYDLTPENDTNFFPGNCLVGQLTTKGFLQHTENGHHLRSVYVEQAGLLPADPASCPDCFLLRADDSDRTIKSGQALFDGMFPDASSTVSSVFPFYTRDEQRSTIIPNSYWCPALDAEFAAASASPAFQKHMKTITNPLMAKVATALNITTPAQGVLFDCLQVHTCHDYPIPAVLTEGDDLAQQLIDDTIWLESYLFNYGRVSAFGTAPLLNDVLQHMNTARAAAEATDAATSTSAPPRKFVLYSGHDTGPMMPLLAAFGLLGDHWAPYASMAVMELYSQPAQGNTAGAGAWAVRFVYNGTVLQLPGCSDVVCPWEEFSVTIGKITGLLDTACQSGFDTIQQAMDAHVRACAALECPDGSSAQERWLRQTVAQRLRLGAVGGPRLVNPVGCSCA